MSRKKLIKVESFKEREENVNQLEKEFIESFIRLRKEYQLTQQTLADEAGVIRETIARIENSITSPQLNTLLKILEPLGYTVKLAKIKKTKKDYII